jgi:hypothetical protein
MQRAGLRFCKPARFRFLHICKAHGAGPWGQGHWHGFRNGHTPFQPRTSHMLTTFSIPERVTGSPADQSLADRMIRAWRTDGIFQVCTGSTLNRSSSRWRRKQAA